MVIGGGPKDFGEHVLISMELNCPKTVSALDHVRAWDSCPFWTNWMAATVRAEASKFKSVKGHCEESEGGEWFESDETGIGG
jgi:hypothetical protein